MTYPWKEPWTFWERQEWELTCKNNNLHGRLALELERTWQSAIDQLEKRRTIRPMCQGDSTIQPHTKGQT